MQWDDNAIKAAIEPIILTTLSRKLISWNASTVNLFLNLSFKQETNFFIILYTVKYNIVYKYGLFCLLYDTLSMNIWL